MYNINYLKHLSPIFENSFPDKYINDVKGWGISKELLHSKNEDNTYKLLTLDIDLGSECRLSCPHCFRKSKSLKTHNPPLDYEKILNLISEAKTLGLQSIKILGAGEPFENSEIYPFLIEVSNLGIHIAVFTKGHILGADGLVKKYYGEYGFSNSIDFIRALSKINVSILLGFNSFKKDVQEAFVGVTPNHKIANYVELRDRALSILIHEGFNKYKPNEASRLALIAAPIKPENIDEIFDIYVWGRRRNIYVLSCPTTVSGLGIYELEREKAVYDFKEYVKDLKQLYIKIYIWNIENNLMTLDKFLEEGVSLYPGAHPCNQVAAGMYITLNGKVMICPGRDDESFTIENDVRNKSLKEIWFNSSTYKMAKQEDKFNYHCVARDGHFFEDPTSFYNEIKDNVIKYFNNNGNK